MNLVRKLIFLLSKKEKIKLLKILLIVVFMAIIDVAGIASLFPFISLLADESIIFKNELLFNFYEKAGFSNIQNFSIFLGICFFILVISSIFIKGYTNYELNRFWQYRRASITTRLLTLYLRQPYSWFININSSDLKDNIFTEVDEVVSAGLGSLLNFISQSVVSLAIVITLFVISPTISLLIFLIITSIYTIIIKFTSKYLKKYGKEKLKSNKKLFYIIGEALGAFKEIKLGGLDSIYIKEYENFAYKKSYYASVAQAFATIPRFILEAIVIGCALIITLTLYVKNQGAIEEILPTLSIFLYGTFKLMPAIQQSYQSFSKLKFVIPAVDLISSEFNKLALKKNLILERERNEKLVLKKAIDIENIFFSYPNTSEETLKNISFKIKSNSVVGFVGKTGSGKSTMVDLILGLIKNYKGSIKIDDSDINNIDIQSWQKNIGYVPQNIYLADATIEANIAFGVNKKDIDIEQIKYVSKIANLDNYVSKLRSGYKTLIGEQGVKLSGGQRQRIAIARALYHSPGLLILDEATSALDTITEKAVMEAINNLRNSITIIIIAHRLSTISKCDKIILFKDGMVIDEGNYEYLSINNKIFKNMIGK